MKMKLLLIACTLAGFAISAFGQDFHTYGSPNRWGHVNGDGSWWSNGDGGYRWGQFNYDGSWWSNGDGGYRSGWIDPDSMASRAAVVSSN